MFILFYKVLWVLFQQIVVTSYAIVKLIHLDFPEMQNFPPLTYALYIKPVFAWLIFLQNVDCESQIKWIGLPSILRLVQPVTRDVLLGHNSQFWRYVLGKTATTLKNNQMPVLIKVLPHKVQFNLVVVMKNKMLLDTCK